MNAIHPLGALIQEVLHRNDWSTRDLAERSRKLGTYMSHTNFNRLKNDPLISIKGETIKLLAAVLQVPETRVAQVALESMGVQHSIEESPALTDFVHSTTEISAHDRRLLVTLVEAMRETGNETANDQEHQPDNVTAINRDQRERRRTVAHEKTKRAARKPDNKIAPDQLEDS